MLQATTHIRLAGFLEPDTSSQLEGYLDPGRYTVLELRTNWPDADTDYARLDAPGLGDNDTWICARWKHQAYAVVADIEHARPEAAIQNPADPQVLDEALLVAELSHFLEFRYDRDRARYPVELRGVRLPVAPPQTNNCCTFVEALLVQAWQKHDPEFTWSPARHQQMMIQSDDDLFSPVTAAVQSGIAVAVEDADSAPARWTIIQGWRSGWRSGHTFLIVDHDPDTDRVLTLESNSAYHLDGVGFRNLGNLRDHDGEPPDYWWRQASSWTWQRIRATYHHRRQAALKIIPGGWSKRA